MATELNDKIAAICKLPFYKTKWRFSFLESYDNNNGQQKTKALDHKLKDEIRLTPLLHNLFPIKKGYEC